jgi:hypothetical protein
MTYTSKRPFSLPMFQALMGAMEGEAAISRGGFALMKSVRKGDSTFSEWEPRKGGRKESPITLLKVTRSGGRLLEFAAYDKQGSLKKKVSYGDFQDVGGEAFPCRIRTEEIEGRTSLVEEFSLSGLQVNPSAPSSVENWRIPADFTVKEFRW